MSFCHLKFFPYKMLYILDLVSIVVVATIVTVLGTPPISRGNDTAKQLVRLPSINTKFLLLDKYCVTMAQHHLRLRFLLNSAFLENLADNDNENCWVELKGNGQVPKEVWKKGGELKVIIHGLVSGASQKRVADEVMNDQQIFDLGEEYKKHREHYNVIAVDWTSLAGVDKETDVAASIRQAGFAVSKFLIKHQRHNQSSSDWDSVHLIGISAGAHVAGVAGYQLQHLGPVTVGRITGVDPDSPGLEAEKSRLIEDDASGILDSSDAKFVDIIHCHKSNINSRQQFQELGILGHADFYPNGGKIQSSQCNNQSNNNTACTDERKMCVKLYTDSIQNRDYLACRCQSWKQFHKGKCSSSCKNNGVNGTLLGDRCFRTASGKYYLRLDSQ